MDMNGKGATAKKSCPPDNVRALRVDDNPCEVISIPLNHLSPSPDQARRDFDEGSLKELADSIRSVGIIHPIIVTKATGRKYTIIAGERRYRACDMLGLKTIPAVVMDSKDALEIGLIENLQRKDLNLIEKCEAFHRLKTEKGYTDSQIGEIAGISRISVNEFLALDRLPEAVKEECRTSDTPKAILYDIVTSFKEKEEMLHAWQVYTKSNMTVRTFREWLKKAAGSKAWNVSNVRTKPFRHKNTYRDLRCSITISSRTINPNPENIVKALKEEIRFWEQEAIKR